jgi:hypothetical protein
VTLWVIGWFLTALAAAEASRELVSCAVVELGSLDLLFQVSANEERRILGQRAITNLTVDNCVLRVLEPGPGGGLDGRNGVIAGIEVRHVGGFQSTDSDCCWAGILVQQRGGAILRVQDDGRVWS